eukprot:TRINITY_DN14614_c0_g2_i1.p1 TRINITY_DN14614_c0_g2~~TRINITY_DN14614_c0_g2_i1.p1  ORF type:complete len:117 (-),score=13.72 TRINITY_DN14614_c0_g2_i1:255-605(-)
MVIDVVMQRQSASALECRLFREGQWTTAAAASGDKLGQLYFGRDALIFRRYNAVVCRSHGSKLMLILLGHTSLQMCGWSGKRKTLCKTSGGFGFQISIRNQQTHNGISDIDGRRAY